MFPALNLLQYVGEHTYITLSIGKLVFDQKKLQQTISKTYLIHKLLYQKNVLRIVAILYGYYVSHS